MNSGKREQSGMEPKPKGGIYTTVRVADKSGREYACPLTALRNPNKLSEEEKAYCEPYDSGKSRADFERKG
jgi:hypothetical protein